MFGNEQSLIQTKRSLKYLYQILGEFRYPIRLRGFYLQKVLPRSFAPAAIWDAGCGEGQTSFFLTRQFPASSLIGTDLTEKAINRCTQIAQKTKNRMVTFAIGDITHVDFDKLYDLIVCFEVLEHIDDYETALSNLAQALKPGGVLILHTPSAGKYTEEQIGLRRWMKKQNPANLVPGQYHVRSGYQLNSLVEQFQKRGLVVELARYTFGHSAMLAHTIYEQTRPRTAFKLATYPFLMLVGMLDWYLPHTEGGGLLFRVRKPIELGH